MSYAESFIIPFGDVMFTTNSWNDSNNDIGDAHSNDTNPDTDTGGFPFVTTTVFASIITVVIAALVVVFVYRNLNRTTNDMLHFYMDPRRGARRMTEQRSANRSAERNTNEFGRRRVRYSISPLNPSTYDIDRLVMSKQADSDASSVIDSTIDRLIMSEDGKLTGESSGCTSPSSDSTRGSIYSGRSDIRTPADRLPPGSEPCTPSQISDLRYAGKSQTTNVNILRKLKQRALRMSRLRRLLDSENPYRQWTSGELCAESSERVTVNPTVNAEPSERVTVTPTANAEELYDSDESAICGEGEVCNQELMPQELNRNDMGTRSLSNSMYRVASATRSATRSRRASDDDSPRAVTADRYMTKLEMLEHKRSAFKKVRRGMWAKTFINRLDKAACKGYEDWRISRRNSRIRQREFMERGAVSRQPSTDSALYFSAMSCLKAVTPSVISSTLLSTQIRDSGSSQLDISQGDDLKPSRDLLLLHVQAMRQHEDISIESTRRRHRSEERRSTSPVLDTSSIRDRYTGLTHPETATTSGLSVAPGEKKVNTDDVRTKPGYENYDKSGIAIPTIIIDFIPTHENVSVAGESNINDDRFTDRSNARHKPGDTSGINTDNKAKDFDTTVAGRPNLVATTRSVEWAKNRNNAPNRDEFVHNLTDQKAMDSDGRNTGGILYRRRSWPRRRHEFPTDTDRAVDWKGERCKLSSVVDRRTTGSCSVTEGADTEDSKGGTPQRHVNWSTEALNTNPMGGRNYDSEADNTTERSSERSMDTSHSSLDYLDRLDYGKRGAQCTVM